MRILGLSIGLVLSACAGPGPITGKSPYESGLEAFAAGHYGLAEQHLRAAVNHNPSIAAHNALGATYDQIGRFELAQRQYRKALQLDPTSPQTLNNIGYSYLLQNRPDVALVYLRDARRHAATAPPETLLANLHTAEGAIANRQKPIGGTAGAHFAEPHPKPPVRIQRRTDQVQAAQIRPKPTNTRTKPLATIGSAPYPREKRQPRAAAVSATPSSKPASVERPAAPDRPTLTISNGADRIQIEDRVRDHLVSHGWTTNVVKTAAHHSHQWTTIFYRASFRQAAEQLGATLRPSEQPIQLQLRNEQNTDLVLRLGNDLLSFDEALFRNSKTVTAEVSRAPAAKIEISNGAGRPNMAARTRSYLKARGFSGARLTNADHFGHAGTTIFYRLDHRETALAIAKSLPIDVRLVENEGQLADVRVELGHDYLSFDAQLARAPPHTQQPT